MFSSSCNFFLTAVKYTDMLRYVMEGSRGSVYTTVPNFVAIQTVAEIWRFLDLSKMALSWICDAFLATHEGHLVVFVTVQSVVGIDAVVSIIMCKF